MSQYSQTTGMFVMGMILHAPVFPTLVRHSDIHGVFDCVESFFSLLPHKHFTREISASVMRHVPLAVFRLSFSVKILSGRKKKTKNGAAARLLKCNNLAQRVPLFK